jgi:hypothetical protein
MGHEPGLSADLGFAHVALELALGVSRPPSPPHHVHRPERTKIRRCPGLFAVVGLGDEQFVGPEPRRLRSEVQGVLGVDEAAVPPRFWASAMIWQDQVVLPGFGPKISVTRPMGTPPLQSQVQAMDPVG